MYNHQIENVSKPGLKRETSVCFKSAKPHETMLSLALHTIVWWKGYNYNEGYNIFRETPSKHEDNENSAFIKLDRFRYSLENKNNVISKWSTECCKLWISKAKIETFNFTLKYLNLHYYLCVFFILEHFVHHLVNMFFFRDYL